MKLSTPSREELEAARTRKVPDVIAPDLRLLLCGINPGLLSAAVGHHFARPGNRFWPAMHQSGLTPRRFRPDEEQLLLGLGIGITNMVPRTTAAADELDARELIDGRAELQRKVERLRPKILAVLGVGAFRTGFDRKRAVLGRQPETIGDTLLWVLPSPSGLNAHYSLKSLVAAFGELRDQLRSEHI